MAAAALASSMRPRATLQRIMASEPERPETASYAAGQLIASKYRLERLLGEGGMGAVWLAHNVTLESDVALKLIHRELATPDAAARLLREARVAARLEHPAIVQVFDFGETEQGDPFIVMEVVRGESLGSVLDRKGRIAALNAVQLLLPIAGALSLAHARGIVHRDVKPDNIILVPTEKGTNNPKLVDFGIAKLGQQEEAAASVGPAIARRARAVTEAGTVMGSPGYLSPEQITSGSSVDHRADIWAFSVSLYETMSGCLPFDDKNFNRLVSAILTQAPQPTTDHGAGDERLWAIVRTGLEKEPDARWPSMRAMGALLAQWLLDNGVTTDITGASLELHWLSEGAPSLLSCPPPSGDAALSASATEPVLRHVATEQITAAPLADPDAAPPPPTEQRSSRAWIAVAAAGLLTGTALMAALLPRVGVRDAPARAATFTDIVVTASAPAPAPPPPRTVPESAPFAPAPAAASPASSEHAGVPAKRRQPARDKPARVAPPSDPGF